jgi:hypothetical protein
MIDQSYLTQPPYPRRRAPNPYDRLMGTPAEPDYTYQDVYDPMTQPGGPYAKPQPQRVGRFDYEDGRIAGSTDFYGNRYDTRGLPLGPEQAQAMKQVQAAQPAASVYQYGGPVTGGQRWTTTGQPEAFSTVGPISFTPPPPGYRPEAPNGALAGGVAPGGVGGTAGRFLSPQNLQRAQMLGYDPVVFQQFIDQGMDPADAERAALTYQARTAIAGYAGYDPRTGAKTLAREEYETKALGEAYRNDQRYNQALASAAQQRMAAQQNASTAEAAVNQRLFEQHLPIGRPANTADIANAQAAMRADPTYWQQINTARTAAAGGVTQGAQRAAGVLDRGGPSFTQTLDQIYGGNQYRYGA